MKHYRVLPLLLALALLLTLPPALATDSVWIGPLSEDAIPTVLDTGRGYIAYYFYASAIYWSPDCVNWTDLSDRSWVQEARDYIRRALGHREFQIIWTGTEYMMRQDLRDDARSAYQTIGDSPRNASVTFLDQEFQIIGELPLGGAVTDIRYEDNTYYATVDDTEVAFTREAWLPQNLTTEFSDVPADAWYAQGVALCAEEGLMVGTGRGQFSPDATLTDRECAVLALRLYDLCHGGDGVFEKAPEDWGWATLALADGQVLSEGYFDDSSIWHWSRFSRVDSGHLSFDLETKEAQAWGRAMDYQQAVFSMNGVDCYGELHLSGFDLDLLYFEPMGGGDFYAMETNLYPAPGEWYRDAWYYADQHDLRKLTYHSNLRGGFADAIFAVTGELEPVNDIFALPDTQETSALALCRAGVLAGTDEYGTFSPYSTLTRAEAATILARVLHPELRQQYTILPLETYEDYTLTYLCDTEGDYPFIGEQVVAIDRNTLLFLDGAVVQTPEGWEIERLGANDACVADYSTATYGVMDFQGQVTLAPWWEARERPGEIQDRSQLFNGYRSGFRFSCFHNEQGEQVTPTFTWMGVVNAQGQSFVCQEGKVYRIEFGK